MTLEQIIKETENLSIAEQKKLISYFFIKLIDLENNEAVSFLFNNTKQEINKNKRDLKIPKLNLDKKLDDLNIREFAYD